MKPLRYHRLPGVLIMSLLVSALVFGPTMEYVFADGAFRSIARAQREVDVSNVALGKPVTITTNGADDSSVGAGLSPADVTDGSLDYERASFELEDGVVGYVNNDYDELMEVAITIDLEATYQISSIRYNVGDVQFGNTWNADRMITPFGETTTNPGDFDMGAWTEQTGSTTASSITIRLQKTRTSLYHDWLFIGEIEVYGEVVPPTSTSTSTPTSTHTPTNTPAATTMPTAVPANMWINTYDAPVGSEVPIVIQLDTYGALLGSVETEIAYDPAVVRAVSCQRIPTNAISGGYCNVNSDADGQGMDSIKANAISSQGLRGEADLWQVTFQSIGPVGNVTELSLSVLSYTDPNGTLLAMNVLDGEIEIVAPVLATNTPTHTPTSTSIPPTSTPTQTPTTQPAATSTNTPASTPTVTSTSPPPTSTPTRTPPSIPTPTRTPVPQGNESLYLPYVER